MAQQTVVDYLVNLYYTQYNVLLPSEDYEQGKKMFEEQIVESWHNGYDNQSPMIDEANCGQTYYDETYGKTN